ncbi:MAG: gliding motility-associated transporter permease protein [Planctomycetaceae bacterium]|nr:gliding motility-associated transporter permease protein [Planctomycetaceae bacterium]
MFASRYHWSLPLLTKELLEQASRGRTYVIRIVYVFALCSIAFWILENQFRRLSPMAILGQGRAILRTLVMLQFFGIYLFLPAIAGGVFTVEKERNTLGLLLLTRLGPWTIVLEKLSSRLLPMLCLLLCSLPVFAFANSLGGISGYDLYCAVWFQLLAAIQVACVAVMCSAYAHSTTAAFVQTYLVLLSLCFGPLVVDAAGHSRSLFSFVTTVLPLLSNSISRPGDSIDSNTNYFLFSPVHEYILFENAEPLTRLSGATITSATATGIASLLPALVCLAIARFCLFRRATATWWNPLLALFRGADSMFFWLNRRINRNAKSIPQTASIPGSDPVAWRELTRGVLGQFRYLIWILILLELPVLGTFYCLMTAYANNLLVQNLRLPTYPVLFLWLASALFILASTAGIFARERNKQTLDILLTVPLRGSDLILQKLAGVRRVQMICAIPLLTASLVNAWWRLKLYDMPNLNMPGLTSIDGYYWWEYLFGAVTSVIISFELVKWFAVWCGLICRSSIGALTLTLCILTAYCAIPVAIVIQIDAAFHSRIWKDSDPIKWPHLICTDCSPPLFVMANEGILRMRFLTDIPLLLAIFNILIQGSVLLALRRHILTHADWYLGRGVWK